MTYLGTSFALTLGAWRIRLRLDIDDALDDAERPPSARAARPPAVT